MMRNKQNIILDQLDTKLLAFKPASVIVIPEKGWIHTIRKALNMTLEQLGNKLGMTRQGARRIEENEAAGSITLKSLKEAGNALNMKFVYGFVPYEGSMEKLIETKSRELATKIVMRTSSNMKLEDQELSKEHLQKAIEELTIELKNEISRSLWD